MLPIYPLWNLLAWCPAERCLCAPFSKYPSTSFSIFSPWDYKESLTEERLAA